MRSLVTIFAALPVLAAEPVLWDAPKPPAGFPKFQVQEIASDFKIGYAVHICDVDGDKKPDIVVVDKERVVWYENPTWKMRVITQGKTKPDNVCICSLDIDRDGKLDFVLGAGWKPFDTKTPGTLQWLRRGKSLDDEWEMFPIPCDEPTVHRVQTRKYYGCTLEIIEEGFVLVPLMGRDSTKAMNWMDGRPVRVLEYDVPTEKATNANSWKPRTINEELHVIHNFKIGPKSFGTGQDLFASYEGLSMQSANDSKEKRFLHDANQLTKNGSRGASEVDHYDSTYSTIEPWHGNQVVYYRYDAPYGQGRKLRRVVVDEQLRWGHAVKLSHLVPRDGKKESLPFIVAGVRDNPDPKQGDKFTEKRGVRLYRATDDKGEKWERYILEDGGVAVEDLQVADLNNDGKPEIIAVGRATQNCRIYWNRGK